MFEGLAARARRDHDRDVSLAWHVVAFDRTKRLKALSEYVSRQRTGGAQSPDLQQLWAQQYAAAGFGTMQ